MSLATDAPSFAAPAASAARRQHGAGDALIVVEGVVKIYSTVAGESVLALDNVDLTVKDGEFVCLVGPSGCGKTTLLRLLAGLDTADAGRSSLAGKALNGPSPEVGVVFQQSNLLPWFTVLQNVMLPLRVGGSSRDAGKTASRTSIRTNCPAACSSAQPSCGRLRATRNCC
jgi:NitT/TauT family transport system ATP-binding protein